MKKLLTYSRFLITSFLIAGFFGISAANASTVTVTVTGPASTTVVIGTTFTITATATTTYFGGMANVKFISYTGTTINTDTSSPYSSSTITAPNVPGTYTYKVTGTDNNGATQTVNVVITTTAPNAPTISGGGTGCGSGSVTLTASAGSPAGGTYNWYNVASSGTALATGTTYTPTATGTYYASYTFNTYEGTRSGGTSVTINADPIISTAPTSGAYFSYPFNGNANDATGSGNNGVLQNAPTLTTDRFSAANSAYSFNGVNQYMSTTTGIAAPGPTNFSISVWFKTSSAGGLLVGYSASQVVAGSQYDRMIYMSNTGALYFGLYSGGALTINTTTTYADGNWHHAVATCSTTSGSNLYVDGALQATSATMTAPEVYAGTGYWRIAFNTLAGWPSVPSNLYFTGSLDDIAVYNTTLTASQVYAAYGAGSAPVCAGNALSLQVNSVSGATYSWSGPSSFSSTSQNPTVSSSATTAMAGTYTCTVTAASGCTSTIKVTAVVNSITLPTTSFTATSPVLTGANSTITFTGTFSATSTYTWDFNGGTIASGSGVGPYTVNWSTAGTKTVTLTVTNSSGCYASSTQNVIVNSTTYSTYAYEMPLTLKGSSLGITTDLSNFPFLVTITDPTLVYTTGGCSNKVQFPNGPNYDFAFVDATTGTEVPYQVENYNQTTGTLLVWVKIPTLTHSTNNTLYFYYGSATAPSTHTTAFYQSTWASDYQAVYHFNESTYTGSVVDGTANGHTGTTTGMTSADLVTGKVGNAYSFDGTAKKITANAVNITGTFTISAWINVSSISHDQKILTNQAASGSSTGGYKMGVYSDNTCEAESGTAINRTSTPVPPTLAAGAWHYVQAVFNGSSLSTYVDGSQYRILSTTTAPTSTNPLYIGVGEGGSQYYFFGTIDEARVSNVAKTSDWLNAEYKNQGSPATYITQGSITTSFTNASAIFGGINYSTSDGVNYTYTINSATTAGTPPNDGTASFTITGTNVQVPATATIYGLTVNSSDKLDVNGQTLNVGCNIVNNGTITNTSATAGTVNFDGPTSAQSYTGTSTSTGTIDNLIVNNSAAGTVTITGGAVSINKSITLTKGNLFIDNANSGALTLVSTATQTAYVAAIPSSYSITGNVTAQRFVTGGSTFTAGRWIYRNYRLMSSPVNEGIDASSNYPYSLNYLGASTIITDCTSTYATNSANPSLFLYNEANSPANATFTDGNFVGVTNISSLVASGHISTTSSTFPSAKMYVGDGFMIYFRGDNTHNLTGAANKTKYPYVAPENVTFSTTGVLNQGTYSVVSWTGTAGLMYSTSNPGNATVRGYNLVGNPYPSSIDWSTFSNTNAAAPIYGLHVNPTAYILNPTTSNYDTYNAVTGIATGIATSIIPSGQGFFVQANAASPALTFTESAKSTSQVASGHLLLGAPVAQSAYNSYLRLKLVTDTINSQDMVMGFNSTSLSTFNAIEDSEYLPNSGSIQTLSGMSADSVKTSAKWLALPKNTSNLVLNLNVSAKTTGQYTLLRTDFKAIPLIYDVWLMDKYKKDSLDIRNNTTYIFDIDMADTASFGSNRFSVVVRQNPALGVHLLNFTGTKATGGSQIVWVTENEQNYTNFTVERSSDGGKTFNAIDGTPSNALGTYSFLDKNPPATADMYRLKIVDLNGNITYSNIVTIMYGNANSLVKTGIIVYPNPSKGALYLNIAPGFTPSQSVASAPLNYNIEITNVLGAIMTKTTTHQQSWQTDVSHLMPGTYVISVTSNNSLVGQGTFIKL